MAFAQTSPTSATDGPMSRSLSLGPVRMQAINYAVASGDVAGTATFDRLNTIDFVLVTGVKLTTAPTLSGNTAAIAFADPLAAQSGQIIAFGR